MIIIYFLSSKEINNVSMLKFVVSPFVATRKRLLSEYQETLQQCD